MQAIPSSPIMEEQLLVEEADTNSTATQNEQIIKEYVSKVSLLTEEFFKLRDGQASEEKVILAGVKKTSEGVKKCNAPDLPNVLKTIHTILTWLEGPGSEESKNASKKEALLRGLWRYTVLTCSASSLYFVELSCEYIDVPENLYKAKQEHIEECLLHAETLGKKLSELIGQTETILQQLTESEFDRAKAIEFDRTIRHANIVVESSKEFLASAEKTISDVSWDMKVVKLSSFAFRFGVFGIACYSLYRWTPTTSFLDSTEPNIMQPVQKFCSDYKIGAVVMKLSLATAFGHTLLSFYPKRAYNMDGAIVSLGLKHQRLEIELRNYERKLKDNY